MVGAWLAVVAIATVALAPSGALPSAGRERAALKLRPIKAFSHHMSRIYPGRGPDREFFSSPALADITGDGVPEIVTATMDGWVFAYRSNYTELWRRRIGETAFQASPAVRQLTGSSAPDVVVATMAGTVLVLDGPTGKTALTLRQGPPLHCPAGVDCRPDGFFGTPALADVDGDLRADIVASSYDHTVYAWKANGQLIFRQFIEDTSWSSPVVADIDRDGRPEVIVGGDIYGGSPLRVPEGGLLWVFTRAGGTWHNFPGYPKSIPAQVVWSTPAVGDVDGDGWLDIVVGTGNNFGQSAASQRVYAFTGRTARSLPGWPVSVTGQVSNGPVVADIEADRKADVVFATDTTRVYLRSRNGAARWTKCAASKGTCASSGVHGSVAVADLDGDGVQEVIAALASDLVVFDGKTGAWKASSPIKTAGAGTPSIASIGSKAVIAVQGVSGNESVVTLFTTDQKLGWADWPCFKHDPARSR